MNTKLKTTLHLFYIISLPLPIFFYPNGLLFNETSLSSYQVLPLSFFLSFLIFLQSKKIPIKNNFFQIILTLTFASLLTFSIQYFLTQNPNPSLLIIYLVPMVIGFCNGYQIAKKTTLPNIIKWVAYSASIFSLCHISYSIASMGIISAVLTRLSPDLFGVLGIYQKYIYVPLIFASIFYLLFVKTLMFPHLSKKIDYGCLIILFLETCLLGAREAVLVLFFTCFLFGLLSTYKRKKKMLSYALLFLIFAVGSYQLFLKQHLQVKDITIINRFQGIADPDRSPGGRIEQWTTGWNQFKTHNPLLGEGFSLHPPKTSPHNQYIDFLLKGGVLIAFLFCLFFIHFICHCIMYYHRSKNIIILFPLLLTWILISFMINTPLRAPISGIVMWFFIGTTTYYLSEVKHLTGLHSIHNKHPDIIA